MGTIMRDKLDPQRDHLYEAQREVFSKEQEKDLNELQDFVNGIVSEAWFTTRHPHIKSVVVKDGRGAQDAQMSLDGKSMLLPKGTRYCYIAVHELGHRIDSSGGEDHGAIYTALFLFLVGRVYGLQVKENLARRLKKHDVRWDHKIAKYGRP